LRYSFYKGCFLPVRLPHIEKVSVNVLGELGVELRETPGFSCCPEPVGFLSNDKLAGMAVAARNISLAEEEGLDIITLCNGCTYTLRHVNHALKADEEAREKVNEVLSETDHQFKGTIDVRHFASVLVDDLGLHRVAKKIEKPLEGITVAGHTGCHIVSPPEVMEFDDPFDPRVLDGMISVLGSEPADFDLKTLCCGWTLTNYGDRSGADKLLGSKLEAMQRARSDCISVICPQCFYQFDMGQLLASRRLGLEFSIPVLFYLQLLGLSMGYSQEDIGFKRHRVKSSGFEEKLQGVLG
jgi:heterodisulfide reductase subunit B